MLNLDWNIIYTFVNLIILYLLLRKFLFGPVTNMMEKRREEINASFAAAETAKKEAAELKKSYAAKIREADSKAADILREARGVAAAEKERIIENAKNEAGAILEKADKQIELEKEKSLKNIRSEIASIAMEAAVKAAASGDLSENAIDSIISEIDEGGSDR